ncbi:hypothetical protein EDB85DRAFT_2153927 [Lactarius pseudohatsudake]|nr:hypothetical protein EDB85DRAFT_2153927 [Lactarius pseudohatsudake]
MPRKSCKRQARARNAKIARRALHPLDARPPVAESGHVNTGTSQYSSREDLQVDPELASFCQRFNLEPRVQDFEDEDRDDAHDPGNSESDRDPSDGPEIFGQSELDHFSAVLRHAQQIAIELEKENERSRKRKTPRHYTGDSLKTSYRRKKAKTQLAEKGFLGVFEYLDLQKQTRATSITAASVTEASVPACYDLTTFFFASLFPVRYAISAGFSFLTRRFVFPDSTYARLDSRGSLRHRKPPHISELLL